MTTLIAGISRPRAGKEEIERYRGLRWIRDGDVHLKNGRAHFLGTLGRSQ